MESSSSSSSKEASAQRWRPRQYVLLGMGVILAVSALTIVTSIVLQPTDISFSVGNFSWPTNGLQITDEMQVEPDSVEFDFVLTAYNPSHRAGVVYRYVLVSMQLRNDGRPSVRKTSVPTNVTSKFHQARNSNLTMRVKARLDNEFYKFYSSNPSATILVSAQAQFKVGWARSRTYNIRVGCEPIKLASVTQNPGLPNCYNCSAVN